MRVVPDSVLRMNVNGLVTYIPTTRTVRFYLRNKTDTNALPDSSDL